MELLRPRKAKAVSDGYAIVRSLLKLTRLKTAYTQPILLRCLVIFR